MLDAAQSIVIRLSLFILEDEIRGLVKHSAAGFITHPPTSVLSGD